MKKTLLLFLLLLFLAGCSACNRTLPASTPSPTSPIDTIDPTATATPPPDQAVPDNPADIIFHNGSVLTINPDFDIVEAIAIQGETIIAVGSNQEILAMEGPDTEIIDLNGLALLPGFIDGHTHVIKGGYSGSVDYDLAMDTALSYGLTTVNEMNGEAGFIEDMQRLADAGQLRMRVNVFTNINFSHLEDGHTIFVEPSWSLENPPILDHESRIRVTGVKIFVDGAGGEVRGCPALTLPYEEEFQDSRPEICGTQGNLYLTQEELNPLVLRAQEAGFSVSMHAMGDRGIDTALNAIEYALNGDSNDIYRHAIQHSSWLRPDQIERYKKIRPLASVRGYFNTCEQDFYVDFYGHDRDGWWANRFALPNLGIHAFGEGDFGWTTDHTDRSSARPLDPLLTLYGLVTHKQLQVNDPPCDPGEVLSAPERTVDIESALRMLTIEPAYEVFQEDYLGSLEPGKFADLVILSESPLAINPDDLADLKVWMTMVGGKVEFCSAGHEDLCPITQPGSTASTQPENTAIPEPTESPVEPISIKLSQNDMLVSAGTPVALTFGIGCDSEEIVNDFISELILDISLDGQPLLDTQNYWEDVEEAGDVDGDGDIDYKALWSYPLGVLDPGTHQINSQVSLLQTVTDGFDFDGDGFEDQYSGLIYEFSLQLTVEE